MPTRNLLLLLSLLCASGCATVLEGRTQEIAVDTLPEGASCVLRANDQVVGVIESTPGRIKVDKSKYDIVAECSKEGYIKSKIKNRSDMAATSLGNYAMLTYSFIGTSIDSATGAANKYDNHMVLTLDVDKDFGKTQAAQAMPAAMPQPQPVVAAAAAQKVPPLSGKYASVENLATKKPEAPLPSLPSEQAVPYMQVTSAPLGAPAPALASAPPVAPPAPVTVAATVPPVVPAAALLASTLDKAPAAFASVPRLIAKVAPMPEMATLQMAKLEVEQCPVYKAAPMPENPWY